MYCNSVNGKEEYNGEGILGGKMRSWLLWLIKDEIAEEIVSENNIQATDYMGFRWQKEVQVLD